MSGTGIANAYRSDDTATLYVEGVKRGSGESRTAHSGGGKASVGRYLLPRIPVHHEAPDDRLRSAWF
eukprot:3130916-Rhodomonas_salina.3